MTIPDTITGLPVISIGEDAIAFCTSLSSVAIGSSVTNIGEEAFVGCSGLGAITVDVLNSFYSSANGVLFARHHRLEFHLWRRPDSALAASEPGDFKEWAKLWCAKQHVWFHHLLGDEHFARGGSKHQSGWLRLDSAPDQHAYQRFVFFQRTFADGQFWTLLPHQRALAGVKAGKIRKQPPTSDRAHRIGQTKSVFVCKLITVGTEETKPEKPD